MDLTRMEHRSAGSHLSHVWIAQEISKHLAYPRKIQNSSSLLVKNRSDDVSSGR